MTEEEKLYIIKSFYVRLLKDIFEPEFSFEFICALAFFKCIYQRRERDGEGTEQGRESLECIVQVESNEYKERNRNRESEREEQTEKVRERHRK